MNYKLLLGLILLSVIVFPYLPAATQTTGQFPSTITWGVTTQQDVGILKVASGEYDVFMFSNPLFWFDTLDPTVRANLTLIRTVTTYVDLVFNVAQNVIDTAATDYPEFLDVNYPGYYIPGLLLVDPDELGLAPYEYPVVNWTDIANNATALQNLHFNPLAIREIRFAFNYLIDRQLIVDQIYHGSAAPRYGAISSFHPYYPNVEDVYFTMFGFSASGDIARAQNMYLNALTNVNATLLSVSGGTMYLYFKPDPNAPGGKWLYFVKPDGTEEPVVINFLIRIEDERKDVGLQIADWIEKYFYIKVNRYLRERTIIYTAYFSNPVKTDEFGFIDTYWSIYTEGWVSTAEDIDIYARYDTAFFYLPLGGYGPNGYYWPGYGWYWYNETLYNYMLDAYYGTYTDATALKTDIKTWFIEGLRQSIRVFIADTFEYFAANKNTFAGVVPGVVTGLYTVWALRTLQFTKPTAKLLEFSATGALFMSVWNPVMGFTDIYSELMHRMLTDFDFWPRPDNGMLAPIRVESYKVERGPFTLDTIDGYIYDPIQEKWVHVSLANDTFVQYTYENWGGYNATQILNNATSVDCKVTVNYIMGKWHDGSNITMADILYAWAFSFEWDFPDNVATNETDPYYYEGLESGLAGLATVFGIKVVNDTAITVWVDYDDVYDVLVADYAVGWPDMPWHVMAAAEELVATGAIHGGTGYPYNWEDVSGQYKGIDFLDSYCVQDVRNMLSSFASGSTIPHAIKYFRYPGLFDTLTADNITRYNSAINFIDTYGHAYISSGPYFVSSYDPDTYTMTMQAFPDYPIDRTTWLTAYTVKTVSVTKVEAPTTVWLAFNGSLKMRIDIEFYQVTPTYKKLSIDPSKVFVTVSIFYYNGTKLADVPSDYITVLSNGSIIIDVPPSWLHQIWPEGGTPGYIVYNVGYEESATTVTGYVETDFYSTPTPIGVPEPTILPLLVLVALLLFILIIRRK